MSLDAATLAFAGGIVAFSCGLALLFYWFQDRMAWAAFWWAAAGWGSGIGISLLALHGVLPHVLSNFVAPSVLDLCAALTWVAARIFNRGSVNPRPVAAWVAAWIAALAFTGSYANGQLAAAFGTGVSGCLYVAAAIEFWRGRNERLRGRWPMIVLLGVNAFALFLLTVNYASSMLYVPMPAIGWLGIINFVGLVYAVGAAISLVTMLNERSEAKYKADALVDPLTGLANRRAFMDRAQRLLARSDHDTKAISLLAFDLDQFKRINDSFGHSVGDDVLRIFADSVSRSLRPSDFAARMGGEEFVAVLPGCDVQAALAIAGRIRVAFQDDARFVNGRRVGATVSVGVAIATGQACSLADILASADGALYQAKALGRNRVMLAEGAAYDPYPANVVRIA